MDDLCMHRVPQSMSVPDEAWERSGTDLDSEGRSYDS